MIVSPTNRILCPVTPAAPIKHRFPFPGRVRTNLHDVLDEEVRMFTAGQHPSEWHQLTQSVERMSSGMFPYRIIALPAGKRSKVYSETRKMLVWN